MILPIQILFKNEDEYRKENFQYVFAVCREYDLTVFDHIDEFGVYKELSITIDLSSPEVPEVMEKLEKALRLFLRNPDGLFKAFSIMACGLMETSWITELKWKIS